MTRLKRTALAISILASPLLTVLVPAVGGPAPSVNAAPATYVVVDGDTLIGISAKLDVSLGALLQTNDLKVTSLIVPGQRLTVPAGGFAPAASSGGTGGATTAPGRYVVVDGDTLIRIANRHGVGLSALLEVNDMTVTSLIMPGMRLALPAGATAPTGTVPAATGSVASAGSYTVVAGDSLFAIAARHNVGIGSLLSANSMTLASLILPGQRLTLPAGATATPVPSTTAGSASGGSTSAGTKSASAVDRVVDYALAQVGKPYEFFRAGPASFDCSGLTKAAYAQIGIDLVHHSASQAKLGTAVDVDTSPIRKGDLVFTSSNGEFITHVGLAISDTKWVQAIGPGRSVAVGWLPGGDDIVAVRRFVS